MDEYQSKMVFREIGMLKLDLGGGKGLGIIIGKGGWNGMEEKIIGNEEIK